MKIIEAATGRDAALSVFESLLRGGRAVEPDGQVTLEIAPMTLVIEDPADTLCDGINREGYLAPLAAAEALHLISGMPYGEVIADITSVFPPSRRWVKQGESYGTRITAQLPILVEELKRDPASRRAVALILRPQDLAQNQMSYFCTVELQFLIRAHCLDMHVKMRSNDAWHGLCYNLFQFGQLQATLARVLEVDLGRYYHIVSSMHLYERHWEKAAACYPDHAGRYARGVGRAGWFEARASAAALLEGNRGKTASEDWYAMQLKQSFRK